MRLRMNDQRKRRFEYLMEATDENTKSGALDLAAQYYLRMSGGTGAYPTGSVQQLMERAIEEGCLTPPEIEEILDCEELAIEFTRDWSVGEL